MLQFQKGRSGQTIVFFLDSQTGNFKWILSAMLFSFRPLPGNSIQCTAHSHMLGSISWFAPLTISLSQMQGQLVYRATIIILTFACPPFQLMSCNALSMSYSVNLVKPMLFDWSSDGGRMAALAGLSRAELGMDLGVWRGNSDVPQAGANGGKLSLGLATIGFPPSLLMTLG